MTVERQVLSGLKWGAIAKFATQLFSWIVTLLVIRILEPADYGIMAISAVITSVIAGVGELGLGASLIQAPNATRDETARVQGVLLILNAVCVVLVYLSAPFIAYVFTNPRLELVIQVLSVQFLLGAFAAIPQALAYRELRFRWLAFVDIASGLTAAFATLALALAGSGVWALVLGTLLGYGARTGCLLLGGTFVRPVFGLQGITRLIRFGGAWSGARLVWHLTYQADILIAGRWLAQEAVGIYAVAMQLANLPLNKAMGIVNQVAFSTLSKLQDDQPRVRRQIVEAVRLLSLAAIPALWGIGAVAPELVDVALGSEWHPVIFPLQMMALVAPLRILSTLFATTLSAMGRADIELVNTLVAFGVFALALLMGVRWGIDGLAMGYASGVALSLLVNLPRTMPLIGISLREVLSKCRISLVGGGAMLAVVSTVRLVAPDMPTAMRLGALIAIGAAVYVVSVHALDRTVWNDLRRLAVALRT